MAGTTVADVLLDGLARAGAGRVFAAPGAAPGLLAAARRCDLHAVAAPDAASAGVLAAVTGEVGHGPGALLASLADVPGLLRGLAHARRDRAPLMAITDAGADAGLVAPVVKSSLIVEAASAAHWIAHAARLAMADPRGPVHLVVAAAVDGAPALPVATAVRRGPLPPPPAEALESVGAALESSTRPLLITGLECGLDDATWLRAFAEALPAPVLTTPKGKGTLADPHPLALGTIAPAHPTLAHADLVLLVGVDDTELRPGMLGAGARVARIGRSPWAGPALVAEALGDLALVIEELAPRVRGRPSADWDVAALDRIKRAVTREATATAAGRIVALAREATPAGTLAAADPSALAAWQAVAPHETLTPLGMSIAGYAVTAAVAARLAHPDRPSLAITSPRGVADAAPSLALASTLGLPVMVVALGRLDADTAAHLQRAGVTTLAPVAEAAFSEALGRALLDRGPAVVAADVPPR
jgi:acetolactate synthase-1/2/3 large subunit